MNPEEYKNLKLRCLIMKAELKEISVSVGNDVDFEKEFEKNMINLYYGKNIPAIKTINDYSSIVPMIKQMEDISFLMFISSLKN